MYGGSGRPIDRKELPWLSENRDRIEIEIEKEKEKSILIDTHNRTHFV